MKLSFIKMVGFVLLMSIQPVISNASELLHYWNFNQTDDESTLLTPTYSKLQGANITYSLGTNSEITSATGQNFDVENLNARNGDPTGAHLRVNNPIGTELVFSIPTEGYTNMLVSFATRRSGSGAGIQYWHYTTDGNEFVLFDSVITQNADPVLITFNLSQIENAADNPDFALKVTFAQGEGGDVGNNRFDNFTVDATPLIKLLHYWDFNNTDSYSEHVAPTFTLGGASLDTLQFEGGESMIVYDGGGNNDLNQNLNARLGSPAGNHLRFNNPLFGALIFSLPTTDHENIVVQYASVRSGSGAYLQMVEYTTDGNNYVLYDTMRPETGNTLQQVFTVDLRDVEEVNNNPDFKIKITFAQGGGGTAGNNRFDNVTCEAYAPDLQGAVTGVSLSSRDLVLTEGQSESLVATVSPEDANNKEVVWSSSDEEVATVDQEGLVNALQEGNAVIYVTTLEGGFVDSCMVTVIPLPTKDLIYYWHFNDFGQSGDETEAEADFSLLNHAPGLMTYTEPQERFQGQRDMDRLFPGTALNIQPNTEVGAAARVRNPSFDRSLVFDLNTQGVKDLIFSYAVQRSDNGMLFNIVEYTTDGVNYTSEGLDNSREEIVGDQVWQTLTFDFTQIESVNHNPNFKIRITWEGNNEASNGNNRYDNIVLMGSNESASVPSILQAQNWSVYPNPVASGTPITIKPLNPEPLNQVVLLDLQGRTLFKSNTAELPALNIAPGTYFVVISSQSGTYTQKVQVF